MTRYPALIEHEEGMYTATLPDLDAVTCGHTVDEAILYAEDLLRIHVEELEEDGFAVPPPSPLETVPTPPGTQLVSIPLIRTSPPCKRRISITLDCGTLNFINAEARRRGMSRREYVAWVCQRIGELGG